MSSVSQKLTGPPRIKIVDGTKMVGRGERTRPLWRGVNLSIAAGERVCISGPSGSGKSTLLNCIGMLDTFDSGELLINGTSVTGASVREKMRFRRHHIGYLFQDYALIDNETAAQNVALAARARRTRKRSKPEEIAAALAAVGLDGRGDEMVYQLSGGEQQRVAMARLLLRRPDIVLADEPTASLDRDNAAKILHHLATLARGGAAVVIVSHDPWVISQCERIEELIPYA